MVPQSTARTKSNGGVDGGRSHDEVLADDIWGMTDGEESVNSGALGADGEPMGPSETKA